MKLPPNELEDWNTLKKLIDRIKRYSRRERLQRGYAAFMQGWKWLHIPIALVLAGVVTIHVLEVFGLGAPVDHSDLIGLPPSQACQRCHQDIVQEWQLSMHSQAQTGPIVVAQTKLALEKQPLFERACNNCHSPIGTALTKEEILPLDTDNFFRSQVNGTVMDEGVTCIVCHTLSTAPEERRGMFDNFPVAQGSERSFADMFGPSFAESSPLPNAWHESQTGFMTDNASSSHLCGSCHNVKVDIDGNGEITAFPGSEGSLSDQDSDNQLDENELDVDENGKLQDLVLQTTFDEWEDYVALQNTRGQDALGCVDCHMPRQADSPILTPELGIPYFLAQDRERQSHAFIGVDYDLDPNRYTPEQFDQVQQDR
ncbi:MAG: ammonia-forming cytochrome c nitrite reductase subunit c552, partial [Chloroflexi bacterium]|nr:ammonia-forming cytochrome c nitrite reductase subunit c552 [Chloroflexota bacterium]